MSVVIVTVAVVLLILLRVPVAFALLLPSFGYLALSANTSIASAVLRMSTSLDSFPLLAIPMFILVGNIANVSGLAESIYDFAMRVVGRFRGGLAYVDVLQSLAFSWVSGNAVSDVAMVGAVQVPQMQKRGYSNQYIGGMAAASSLVTPLMPPSLPAIFFGVTSGVSITALFVASVVPALLVVLSLCVAIYFYARNKPHLVVTEPIPGSFWKNVVNVLPLVAAGVTIFGGIFGGIFTPTEAAAVCVMILVVWLSINGSLTINKLGVALLRTAKMSGGLLIIVIGATLFGWVLTVERVPQHIAGLLTATTDNPTVFLLLMLIVLLLVGMLLDPVSAIIILTPVLFPVSELIGVDPVHFGVVFIFALLIGLFTPPVGIVLFVLEAVAPLTMKEIVRGVTPYVALFIGIAVVLVLVPDIVLGLGKILGHF